MERVVFPGFSPKLQKLLALKESGRLPHYANPGILRVLISRIGVGQVVGVTHQKGKVQGAPLYANHAKRWVPSINQMYTHTHTMSHQQTPPARAGRAFAGSRGRGRGAFARTWQFPLEAVSTKDLELLGTLPSPLTRDPPRSFKGKWPSTPL